MKISKYVLSICLSFALLLAQTGCAMVAGHLAIAGGKKVYHKIEDDKADRAQARNEQVVAHDGPEDAGH